jgi:hypothetical protein
MYPTNDGFLEVDPSSGAITECKRSSSGYQCSRVSEGDPLLKEDRRNQAQVAAVPRQSPNTSRPLGPTDEEVDRALDVMERFLRRFLGIVREQRGEKT